MNDVVIVTIDNAKVRRKLRVEEVECRYFSKRLFLFDLHQKAPLNIQRCLLMHDNDKKLAVPEGAANFFDVCQKDFVAIANSSLFPFPSSLFFVPLQCNREITFINSLGLVVRFLR